MLISRFYSHLHSFLHPSQYEKHSDIGRASIRQKNTKVNKRLRKNFDITFTSCHPFSHLPIFLVLVLLSSVPLPIWPISVVASVAHWPHLSCCQIILQTLKLGGKLPRIAVSAAGFVLSWIQPQLSSIHPRCPLGKQSFLFNLKLLIVIYQFGFGKVGKGGWE